jgi:hypothetical protein
MNINPPRARVCISFSFANIIPWKCYKTKEVFIQKKNGKNKEKEN